jgi:hypothetical protein
MKYWLTRLYPHSWRRRYEAEFHALLEQHSLTVWDVFDILRGALDAHWTAITTQQGHTMFTVTFNVRRRTVALIMTVLLGYILSYGVCRTVGLLTHTSQNRYTAISRHTINATGAGFANPTAPLVLFYTPLRLVESAAWPIVDTVTQSHSRIGSPSTLQYNS